MGFFSGLLGGIGQDLAKKDERKYQEQQMNRALRVRMLQEAATQIEKRYQPGEKMNPVDQAMLNSIGQQLDEITGGGGKGGKKGGLTLGKLFPAIANIYHAGQTKQSGGSPSGTDQSAGPQLSRRDPSVSSLPQRPSLSSVPGAPGSGRTDPFGASTGDSSAAGGVIPPVPQRSSGAEAGSTGRGGGDSAQVDPTAAVVIPPMPKLDTSFRGAATYNPAGPDPEAEAKRTRALKTGDMESDFEQKQKEAKALGLTGDALANYVAGRNVEPAVRMQPKMVTLKDGTRMATSFNPAGGTYTAPDGSDVTAQVVAEGASSGGADKILQPAGGGLPYGISKAGKNVLPGMPGWTEEDQKTLDAARASYLGGQDRKLNQQVIVAEARAKALGKYARLYGAMDSDGNLTYVSAADVANNPGRYAPASQAIQTMNRQSIFSELDATTQALQDSIDKLGTAAFDAPARAQIAAVLGSDSPRSAFGSFMQSTYAKTLSPAQIDYVTGLVSLQESALGLRSLAGMGQGSDMLRHAIQSMIPGAGTPSKAYANRQMDLFRLEVNQLRTSVPGIPGSPKPSAGGKSSTVPPRPQLQSATGGQGGGTVKMRGPDGRIWDIPRANVEAAKARGAAVVQ